MSNQPNRGAISGVRTPGVVAGTGRGSFRARIASRFADKGTSAPGSTSRTPDSALILARYRQEQDALGRQAVLVLRNMWDQQINPEPFSSSWPEFYPLLRQVVLLHYRASAASAAKFYRVVSHVDGHPVSTVPSALPNVAKLDRVSDSVANGTFYHHLNKLKETPGDASAIARNTMSGAGARFALMGGRETVIQAALNDPNAQGWERLTKPSACGFCTQHAARGPFSGRMADFHPHDYCGCVAAPLFKGQKPANQDLSSEWKQVTQGKTGVEARTAWEESRRLPCPQHHRQRPQKDGGTLASKARLFRRRHQERHRAIRYPT